MSDLPFGPPPANQEQAVPLRRKLQILWQRAVAWQDLGYASIRHVYDPVPHSLAVGTIWTRVTGWDAQLPEAVAVTPDPVAGTLTVDQEGVYALSLYVAFDGTNNREYTWGIGRNGADPTNTFAFQKFSGNITFENLSAGTLVKFSKGDVIALYVQTNTANTIDIFVMDFSLTLVNRE